MPPSTRPRAPAAHIVGIAAILLLMCLQLAFMAALGSDLDDIQREVHALRDPAFRPGPSIPNLSFDARMALSKLVVEPFNAGDWPGLQANLPEIDLDASAKAGWKELRDGNGPIEKVVYFGQTVDGGSVGYARIALIYNVTFESGEAGTLVIGVADGGDQWPIRSFRLVD